MALKRVEKLIRQKEDIHLEFKEAKKDLPKSLFETICAMLNRDGGDILLGVSDDGIITGVDENSLETLVTNLVNLSNNPEKLDPPFILHPSTYLIDKKWVIHIQVPASSLLHKTAGSVYDRSNDVDYKVVQAHLIAEIYNRKRNHYTEGIIYPALRFQDFREELFPKIRNLIKTNDANHPWLTLSDEQLLQKAGLWKRDFQSGVEGYTLASVLLLGKDEVIQQIVPHYKIDALLRVHDLNRYDDREYIQTNLIDAYEKLMDFVAKHLPDKFHLENDQRINLRTNIFREVVANLLVHREYTNAYPTSFIIYHNRVETENANNPHGEGPINLESFAPYPKNPSIAKFFIQLGRVDELGSGILNVNRFVKEYAGHGHPDFIEGNVFKMVIPIPQIGDGPETRAFNAQLNNVLQKFLKEEYSDTVKQRLASITKTILFDSGCKMTALREEFGISERAVRESLSILIKSNIIQYKGSKKTGGYFVQDEFGSEFNE